MGALFRWRPVKRRVAKEGDRRTVRRFLWWPTCINGETRWLGCERIREECYVGWRMVPETMGFECLKWRPTRWADR